MLALTKTMDQAQKRQSVMNWTDFDEIPGWLTTLAADSGASVAVGDVANGIATLTTGATDNNEAAVYTGKKIFQFADKRGIAVEGLIQFSEAATNKANIAFGLSSAWGANLLVDDGAGPASSFSGALIYKVDGGTAWKCISSVGSTQTISTSTATPGSSSYVNLRIEVTAVGDPAQDLAEVSFFLDDKPLYDSADASRNKPIKHQMTYTNAVAMALGFYAKAGDGTTQTAKIDTLGYSQTRTYAA